MYETKIPGDKGIIYKTKFPAVYVITESSSIRSTRESGKTVQKSRIGVICNCESGMSGVII